MRTIRDALPMIHAAVGRYLDREDSFEDARLSLAGVLRQVHEFAKPVSVDPKPPTTAIDVRKLTPEQWTNPMMSYGGMIEGFSFAPPPWTAKRNHEAQELVRSALELL